MGRTLLEKEGKLINTFNIYGAYTTREGREAEKGETIIDGSYTTREERRANR
jgi:hypothetical protein